MKIKRQTLEEQKLIQKLIDYICRPGAPYMETVDRNNRVVKGGRDYMFKINSADRNKLKRLVSKK